MASGLLGLSAQVYPWENLTLIPELGGNGDRGGEGLRRSPDYGKFCRLSWESRRALPCLLAMGAASGPLHMFP